MHTGVNYAGGTLFTSPAVGAERPSLFLVTKSLSGIPGSLNDGAIPHILIAYGLLLAWIRWRHGEGLIQTGLARWQER